jgi:cell division septal protein FtsQ
VRKNRLFFLGLTIVLLVALTYTAWVSGLTSRWFYIHEVQITGGERADLHSLDSLIEAYHGQSLFSHDARPLGDAVMALPWVKGVAIGPVFPGKLRLSVDEHQPLYSLWSGKEWYIFCKHGKRLPLHRNQDLGLLPQLAVEANNSGHNTPLENDPSLWKCMNLLSCSMKNTPSHIATQQKLLWPTMGV